MKQFPKTQSDIDRRDFIKKTSLLTAGLAAMQLPGWSKNISEGGYPLHNIPADKRIDPAWFDSICKKSGKTTYLKSKNELQYIGMPCGGMHSGTLYLGGDGRLWLWQIYNQTWEAPDHEGIEPKVVIWNDGTRDRPINSRDGANYVEPTLASNKRVLEQGFALRITYRDQTIIKHLKQEDWEEVSFEATYPMATVRYTDKLIPLEVSLECFSPFIPLDEVNSSFPATILNLTVKNNSADPVDIKLLGWLENGCSKLFATKDSDGDRTSETITNNEFTGISYGFNSSDSKLNKLGDAGTMAFGIINPSGSDLGEITVNTGFNPWPVTAQSFEQKQSAPKRQPAGEKMVGSLGLARQLKSSEKVSVNFVISWHFPNPCDKLKSFVADAEGGYFYATLYADAAAVTKAIANNFKYLNDTTRLWQKTWYDSSLPDWFLERSIIPINTLSTANTYRFKSGRFWSWEGVGACPGTCTHVWQYAHAMARIFPALERDTRERVDLGIGFVPDTGAIWFRGEDEKRPAIDGQSGTILRFYREHQMSADDAFLKRNWPNIKRSIQFMLAQDKNGDGMTDTPMENTLDAIWEGEIAWIVGLCIAAAKAGEQMAMEVNDQPFAETCRKYAATGASNMKEKLFNGEYFIHRPDPVQGRKKLGAYNTCHIDQVYGQSWAYQVGMGSIIDKASVLSALQSIWKYNFTTDVGPYIKTHTGGRPYVLPGEGGIMINTNPKNEDKPYGEQVTWQVEYFHECQSGYEHEVIAHFMAEGMIMESLVAYHAIYSRYSAAKRNPYNEIECSDHYARAMASYGTFINACGFEYHGPKKHIAFNPRLNPEDFNSAFTSAEGWGTYRQKYEDTKQHHAILLTFGKLDLKSAEFGIKKGSLITKVNASVDQKSIGNKFKVSNDRLHIEFDEDVSIQKGHELVINLDTKMK